MSSYSGSYCAHSQSQSYAPSAPSLPESYDQGHNSYNTASAPACYGHPHPPPQPQQPPYHVPAYGQVLSHGQYSFPRGTPPDVIRSFEMVDRDSSGFVDDKELQLALSSGYQKFSMRTIRLLMFLFKNPSDSIRIGPKEFTEVCSCLRQWRAIFEIYDQDRSGKIDLIELRDALYSIGYAVPPTVLQLLIAKYNNGGGSRKFEFSFECFVECGTIVKGLTEKFKEKDPRYTGSATLSYDSFMTTVIPFIVSYD